MPRMPIPPRPTQYIVMPPGHGKTVLHGMMGCVFEVDQIVGTRETAELSDLRDKAKESGTWDEYDTCRGKLLAKKAPPHSIIMVQSYKTGEAAGFHLLASVYLEKLVWEANLRNRKGSVEEYYSCWEAVKRNNGYFSMNNKDTTCYITNVVDAFLELSPLGHRRECVHGCCN